MTVTRALHELDRAWAAAHGAADALRLTLQEDAPLDRPPARGAGSRTAHEPQAPKPVEAAAEPAAEIVALLEVGGGRLEQSLAAIDEDGGQPDNAAAAVAFLQDRWLEAGECLERLAAAQRLLELSDFVRRHGGEWHAWWRSVLRGLEALWPAVRETNRALAECWRELAERHRLEIGAATVGRLRVCHWSERRPSPRREPNVSLPPAPDPAAPTTGER
jgi:hypothetical protein